MPSNIIVITGTDTGVGKTMVTASLASALCQMGTKVGIRKPFASGISAGSGPHAEFRDDDALLLQATAQTSESVTQVRPYSFQAPLAPLSAARMENRTIDIDDAVRNTHEAAERCEILLVEGVGGAAVPITPTALFSDYAAKLQATVLLVSRTTLGTINHTLLTLEHLRAHGAPAAGIVFNRQNPGPADLAEETGPPLICEVTEIHSFGILDYNLKFAEASSLQLAVEALSLPSEPIIKMARFASSLHIAT